MSGLQAAVSSFTNKIEKIDETIIGYYHASATVASPNPPTLPQTNKDAHNNNNNKLLPPFSFFAARKVKNTFEFCDLKINI